MDATYARDARTIAFGELAGRLVTGVLIAANGREQRVGWFRGFGSGYLGRLGFRPGRALAAAAWYEARGAHTHCDRRCDERGPAGGVRGTPMPVPQGRSCDRPCEARALRTANPAADR